MTAPRTLRALDASQIRSLQATGHAVLDGVDIDWNDDDVHNLVYRVRALDLDETSAPYLVHVRLDGSHVCARIGCHSGPEDHPDGRTVEIGYFVDPRHRGRGVATAVVREFLDWLRAQGVARVRATIPPDNTASIAVVTRLGFEHVGELVDEEDGERMLMFVRRLEDLAPRSQA